jgi:hypothetical protein
MHTSVSSTKQKKARLQTSDEEKCGIADRGRENKSKGMCQYPMKDVESASEGADRPTAAVNCRVLAPTAGDVLRLADCDVCPPLACCWPLNALSSEYGTNETCCCCLTAENSSASFVERPTLHCAVVVPAPIAPPPPFTASGPDSAPSANLNALGRSWCIDTFLRSSSSMRWSHS